MPIRPEMKARYPAGWKLRSRFVRFIRARNRCEWCGAENGQPHPLTGLIRHLGKTLATAMNQRDLESWAIRAAQELQELVDDTEDAAPPEERHRAALSAKALLAEFDDIFNGRPTWTRRLVAGNDDDGLKTLLDF